MPLGSFRHRRSGVALWLGIAFTATVWLACSSPDGSGLYQPLGSGGRAGLGGSGLGGASGTGSGSGGTSAGAPALGGAGANVGEGSGGDLPLGGGAAGVGGSGSSVGGVGGAGAPLVDAGTIDAGAGADAGPSEPPIIDCEASEELCDGVDNDCDGEVDSGAACPDDCTGFTLAEHAYMACSEPVDRGIALARCGGEGMKLVWIETPEENEALLASLASVAFPADDEVIVQIGASDEDDEDEWFWIGNAAAFDGFQFWSGNAAEDGGEPVSAAYANWGSGEPNNSDNEDCGLFSVTGSDTRAPGQWDDRACLDELPFLCEAP